MITTVADGTASDTTDPLQILRIRTSFLQVKTFVRGLAVLVLLVLTGCQEAGKPAATPSDSRATNSPSGDTALTIDGLEITLVSDQVGVPRDVVQAGDRSLVVDQTGAIWVLEGGKVRTKPFLDIRSQVLEPGSSALELGLAGLALAPDFDSSGTLYTFSTVPPRKKDDGDIQRVDVLTRWQADPDSLVVDPDSAKEIWSFPRTFLDHVGGELVFDDDGMLYAGVGADTGSEEAQDPKSFDGSVLQYDPKKGKPTIYSYGYRNPFRMTYDSEVGPIVAEPMFSEKDSQVSVPRKGGNAGYPTLSGQVSSCWSDGGAELDPLCEKTEDGDPLVPPAFEYPRALGQIASGAFAYRSDQIPELTDKVIISDWQGGLFAATPGESPWPYDVWELPTIEPSPSDLLWDIGTDETGTIYLMFVEGNMQDGQLFAVTK